MMMQYLYTKTAKKEMTKKRKGRSSRREGKRKRQSLKQALIKSANMKR